MKNLTWLTPIKFIFSVIIILILMSTFLYHTMRIGIAAEKVALQQMMNTIHAHIQLRILSQDLPNEGFTPQELQCFNPLSRFDFPLVNYLGEQDNPDLNTIPDGSWIFDKTHCLLIYKVRFASAFHTTFTGPASARFMTKIEYTLPPEHRIKNIKIIPLETFQWS